jgi:glycosyltransferase involved in cell wall biosynthesis
VLLSAFACSPEWGSEPGVGWRWLVELTKRHDVVLVTHAYFRCHLEPLLRQAPLQGLSVHYVVAAAFGAHPHRQLNSRLFYIWWQWKLRGYVRALIRQEPVDLIHHLTWGTMRFPTFLGNLGVPLVMGPLGGGEVAPMRFFKDLPWRERLFERVRSLTLWWSKIDPIATLGPRASVLVLCRTGDTLNALPRAIRARAAIAPDVGAPPPDLSLRRPRGAGKGPYRLLFAGRLVGWKGVLLAVNAADRLVKSGYDVHLDIVGDGSMHDRLVQTIERRQLTGRVQLLGKLPREDLLALYGRADLFLFPSLHDSGGSVVLEAFSRGLPVVCLDLGGPKHFVSADCGVVVATRDRSTAEVEAALASAIGTIFDQPGRLDAMAQAAAVEAARQTWALRVSTAYELVEQRLSWGVAP